MWELSEAFRSICVSHIQWPNRVCYDNLGIGSIPVFSRAVAVGGVLRLVVLVDGLLPRLYHSVPLTTAARVKKKLHKIWALKMGPRLRELAGFT